MTLDPESDRFKRFKEHNQHLLPHLHQWEAVEGIRINYMDAVNTGLITQEAADIHIMPGSIGCALSHARVWHHVARTYSDDDPAVLVLEDDAMTHSNILEYAERHADELSKVDITLCGHNHDAVTLTTDRRNVKKLLMKSPYFPDETFIENALAKTDIDKVDVEQLLIAFGNPCYWISPKGARKLVDEVSIFPLRPDKLFDPNPYKPRGWPPAEEPILQLYPYLQNTKQLSKDIRLVKLYGTSLEAYLTSPSLAYAPNDQDKSTTRNVIKSKMESNYTFGELQDLVSGGGTKPASLVSKE